MEDRDLRETLEQHEHRVERLIGRILAPLTERLQRIEQKIDKTNGRVTIIERRHIEVDARVHEREKLAAQTAALAAEKTTEILAEREWSLKRKLGVGGLVIAAISVMVPVMTAILNAFPR